MTGQDAAAKQHATLGSASSRTVTDERVRVRLHLDGGRLSLAVQGSPRTTYDLRLTHRGALVPSTRHTVVRTGAAGRATLVIATRLGPSRRGSVTVHTATTGRGVTRTQAVSLFVRPRHGDGLAQAPSDIGARLAVIRADHRTEAGRERALRSLFRASASELGPSRVTAPSALSDDQVEVHGVARWTDWNGDSHPARHIHVKLFAVLPPPTLEVSPQTIEGNTTGGYRGMLGGVTVSDPDDDPATIRLTNDAPAVLALGTTQVAWTATDPAGESATSIQQVTVVDTSAPSLTCPSDVSVVVGGSVVLGQAGVSDVVDPAPSVSNDRPATFGPGRTTVTWRAEDHSENASTCQQHVNVSFPFVGFKAPVDNPPVVNTLKAGQAVPVKFSLLGDRGLGVLASGSPSSRPVDCDISAPTDPIETTTTSQSGLQYDAASDTYTYVWKTDKAWAGTCRQLTVALTDGSTHTALFQLR
jgi:hypothetical protein